MKPKALRKIYKQFWLEVKGTIIGDKLLVKQMAVQNFYRTTSFDGYPSTVDMDLITDDGLLASLKELAITYGCTVNVLGRQAGCTFRVWNSERYVQFYYGWAQLRQLCERKRILHNHVRRCCRSLFSA